MSRDEFKRLPIEERATILVNDDIANGEYGEELREKMTQRYIVWLEVPRYIAPECHQYTITANMADW